MNELTHAVVLMLGVMLGVTDPDDERVQLELKALLVTLHERSESAYAYQDTPRGKAAVARFHGSEPKAAELVDKNDIPLSPPPPDLELPDA